MDIPEHIWRYPTREAIDSLSQRFGFRNEPNMQDWEWEVADPNRVEEFLYAYVDGELSDDERFTLMEIIIQSCEDLRDVLENNSKWQKALLFIEDNIDLHIYSVWYWSDLENEDENELWRVTPYLQKILNKYKDRYLHNSD